MHLVIIVQSSSKAKKTESKLVKCWNVLTFLCVQEAITSGLLQLFHIPGTENHADLLTKFLSYNEAICYLCPHVIYAPTISAWNTSDIPMKGSVK